MESKVVHEKQFKTKINGYSCVEVDIFMDEIADALDGLNASVEELTRKNAELQSQVASYKEMDNALRDSIITAQKMANEITNEARQRAFAMTESAAIQADGVVNEANAKAAAIVNEATASTLEIYEGEKRLRLQIEEYKKQIRSVMSAQLSVMEEIFNIGESEEGGEETA